MSIQLHLLNLHGNDRTVAIGPLLFRGTCFCPFESCPPSWPASKMSVVHALIIFRAFQSTFESMLVTEIEA
jgi:hypothetical protein